MDEIRNRALYLLRLARPKRLSQLGETNHERWKNISKGAIRMGGRAGGPVSALRVLAHQRRNGA